MFPGFDRILTVEESERTRSVKRMAQVPAGVLAYDLLSVAPSKPSHTGHTGHLKHLSLRQCHTTVTEFYEDGPFLESPTRMPGGGGGEGAGRGNEEGGNASSVGEKWSCWSGGKAGAM